MFKFVKMSNASSFSTVIYHIYQTYFSLALRTSGQILTGRREGS